MSINRQLLKKYQSEVNLMRRAGLDDEFIESTLHERNDLDGWEPITFKELKKMSEDKLKKLLSYCWHDSSPRCDTIGITNIVFSKVSKSQNKLEFSDDCGDPEIYFSDENQKIHKLGDGTWNYGLYKKTK